MAAPDTPKQIKNIHKDKLWFKKFPVNNQDFL